MRYMSSRLYSESKPTAVGWQQALAQAIKYTYCKDYSASTLNPGLEENDSKERVRDQLRRIYLHLALERGLTMILKFLSYIPETCMHIYVSYMYAYVCAFMYVTGD